ncbi:cation transporter [uncultured Mailhella sp.]|uniref:cation transporter n=1 Tax=uncultured Mailhella sp. TaxID=1981031 RepID=UPI00260E2AA7|nr:cation transporter [uncultured Mailhella sp.]
MKKSYILEKLCCPNCAAKIERAISALDGVRSCSLAFFTKRLTLDIEDEKLASVVEAVKAVVHRIEMDVVLVEK